MQHAGLLYRGRHTGILVDPHFHSSYEPDDLGGSFLRPQFEGLVDAILAGLKVQDPNAKIVGNDRVEQEPYGLAVAKGNASFAA